MSKRSIVLGALLLLGLTACGGDDGEGPAPTPPEPPPPPVSSVFNLDPTVSACVDLNAHVNNHWLQATTLRPDQSRLSALGEVDEKTEEQLRTLFEAPLAADADPVWRMVYGFYHDGLDEARLQSLGFEPARPEWNRIGSLSSSSELRQYLRERLAAGMSVLYDADVNNDFANPSRRILFFAPDGFGLPTSDYYSDPDYEPVVAAYIDFLQKLLERTGMPEAQAREQAELAFDVEQQLAAHVPPPAELADPSAQYQLMSVSTAEAWTPNFAWAQTLEALGLAADLEFSVMPGTYFPALNELIDTLPMEQWQAYLRANWVRTAASFLDQGFRSLDFEFYGRVIEGRESPSVRWRQVLRTVNNVLGEPLGQAYVQHFFEPERKTLALEIVDRVHRAMRQRLATVDWLGEATRAEALAKVDSMTFAIAYPDVWNDWSDLELVPGDYFGNMLRLSRYDLYRRELPTLGPAPEVPRWEDWPQTVNAYYSPLDNHMVFLAAIMQAPALDANADMAVNLGGFGAVVGHEISHAFDANGSQFDNQGRWRNWWTDADRAAFEARAARLRDQAEEILPWPEYPELRVNGDLTLNENIADLGGLNAAYDALQAYLAEHPEARQTIDGLTPEQRLFLSWAQNWRSKYRYEALKELLDTDSHAPGPVRAVLPMQNIPAFAQAFSCPEGSPMVLPAGERAQIW